MANSSQSNGIGFGSVLALIFITLKLTKTIDWSWWWVLAPFWLPIALFLIIFLVGLFYNAILDVIEYFKKEKAQ
jgi:hypothetical protein